MTPASAQYLKHLANELVNSTARLTLSAGEADFLIRGDEHLADRNALHRAIDALTTPIYKD